MEQMVLYYCNKCDAVGFKITSFLGLNENGMASIVNTTGNPDGHIVLRGGSKGPNFESDHVKRISAELRQCNLPHKVMIDCSHGNSNKDWKTVGSFKKYSFSNK